MTTTTGTERTGCIMFAGDLREPVFETAEPWPTVDDVWYDHVSQVIVVRKTLGVPEPVRSIGLSS